MNRRVLNAIAKSSPMHWKPAFKNGGLISPWNAAYVWDIAKPGQLSDWRRGDGFSTGRRLARSIRSWMNWKFSAAIARRRKQVHPCIFSAHRKIIRSCDWHHSAITLLMRLSLCWMNFNSLKFLPSLKSTNSSRPEKAGFFCPLIYHNPHQPHR